MLTDFDGTLSRIVDRPEWARAVRGASSVLEALARRFAMVAIISGRELDDLRTRISGDGVLLLGSYGRERSDQRRPAETGRWDEVAEAATNRLEQQPGVVVERKSGSVAIHYRLSPVAGDEVARVAAELAREFGLDVRRGRLVADLTEPGPGKAEAAVALIAEANLASVLYAGDDAADLEAFVRLRDTGAESVLVAVASDEAPPGLVDVADIVVPGPDELVELLGELDRRSRR